MQNGATLLVVAPWLSQTTREALQDRGISFLDLTGNVLVRAERPAVYVRLQGAQRDPAPRPQSAATLQGAKARRLVRTLVDHRPPYRLTQLAAVTGLSQSYVSKLLDTLHDQALVDRPRRGEVKDVAWFRLLDVAGRSYTPFRNSQATPFVAPAGAAAFYKQLASDPDAPTVAVTGAFAAREVAPVAGAAQLAVYSTELEELRRFGRLVPTDEGADVVVLHPDDAWVMRGTRTVGGLPHVALSQLVLDCVNGPGRLPEQGEAVLRWMVDHEQQWRARSLS
ncbi:IclR-like helix-turn-helix domain-containing protein [Krasilnikovia cinnamomea]|uniref:IclR-like helix-turn-helix domain-containing protein n=1 Tax=Krasilnikovia cinnamomea TaxID=349313 RepID=A0A4V6MG51_9ACTN|nr:IclR-like helix-turn-helix domain-containing protein [Krasilnikovia cinnamomea]